ncbi:MAG: dTMP kinase [Sphingomonas sp.]
MSKAIAQGRFISLEGGEGAGKSTQAKRLMAALAARAIPAILTREPGGSAGGEAVRALLMEGEVNRWSARAEALLFAAARADHIEKVIQPALNAGQWVVCDRFLDSSRAYQGVAGGMGGGAILALHQIGSQGFLPDRTILLDMPAGMGRLRAETRDGAAADRFAARGDEFHAQVNAAFRGFAKAEPERFRIVDASAGVDAVAAAILAALGDWLPV